MRLAVLLGLLFIVLPATTDAQIPTTPRHVGQGRYVYQGERSPVEILTQHQTSGNWLKLQAYAKELLQDLTNDPVLKPLLGNVEKNYYYLVWESKNSEGKWVANRVLVHASLEPQHATRLPGLESTWGSEPAADRTPEPSEPSAEPRVDENGPELIDVLISPAQFASLTSVYVAKPTPDPLLAQVPDVVSKINALGYLARALGTGAAEAPSVLVYVNQPRLPVKRGSYTITDAIVTRRTSALLVNEVETTHASVKLRQARTSPCAGALADKLKEELTTIVKSDTCAKSGEDCAKELKGQIEKTYTATVSACPAEPPAGIGYDPVQAVEQEFAKLVAVGGARVTKGEFAMTNTPLTRFSFGLMTGLLIGKTTLKEERVKVDGGKIVNAPLDRALSMVVVNIHPISYDSDWPRVSFAERFRLFGGTVLTPDFGFTAGAGFGLLRGLTVNAGAVWLLMETPKSDERIGEAPVNANDPFKTRVGTGGFIGLSYTFK